MDRPTRRFLSAVLTVWMLLGGMAVYLSYVQHIAPATIALIVPPFCLEAAFYLLIGAEELRQKLMERFSPRQLAAGLWISALLPYLTYATLTGTASVTSIAWLLAVSTVLCGWFLWLPRRTSTDLLFLLLMAALLIYRPSSHIYVRLIPKIDVNVLGRFTYIRTGLLAVLLLRRLPGLTVGFFPTRREWRVGLLHYALFLPVGWLLFQVMPLGQVRLIPGGWDRFALLAVGYFVGILWSLGLYEEFLCRGFLQPVLSRALHSEWAGWLLASLVFGITHLWFRGFPNWHWVILASILGLFCGHAYWRTRSVRSSMVTHALVVATWKVFYA